MLSRLLLLRQKRSDEVTSAIHPLFRDPSASNTRRRPREADSNGTQTKRPKVNQGKGGTEKVQGKKKKQLQMRLSAIQLVGGGPVSPRHDKTDLKGLWHLDWATPDGVFKEYLQANTHGGIHIAKSGVYLMYAQLSIKKGYEVIKQTGTEKTVLMECYMDHMYTHHSTETCVSMRLYMKPDDSEDRIFIKEMEGATGAVYGKASSVLGLIRIDDFQSLSALFE